MYALYMYTNLRPLEAGADIYYQQIMEIDLRINNNSTTKEKIKYLPLGVVYIKTAASVHYND